MNGGDALLVYLRPQKLCVPIYDSMAKTDASACYSCFTPWKTAGGVYTISAHQSWKRPLPPDWTKCAQEGLFCIAGGMV